MDTIAPPRTAEPARQAAPSRLHDVLRKAREASGLSLMQLSERSYIDDAYISRLERGLQANPSRDTLIRFGIGLGLGIDGINNILTAAGLLPLVRQ